MGFRPLFQVQGAEEAFEPLAALSAESAPGGFRPLVPGRLGARAADRDETTEAAVVRGGDPGDAGVPVEAAGPELLDLSPADVEVEPADDAEDASALAGGGESEPGEDVALHKAYDEAYAMGHAEGLEAGKQEVAARLERLDAVLAELATARQQLFASAAADVASAVVHIAQAVVQRELAVDSSGVARLVTSVIDHLQPDEEIVVRVAPEDEMLILEAAPGLLNQLGRNGSVAVLADPDLHPGGATVETKLGAIDASVETRFAAFADEVEAWKLTEAPHAV